MEKDVFLRATPEALAEHIAKRRGTMSKSRFAEVLGTSRSLIDQWEKGILFPAPKYMEKLGFEDVSYLRVVSDEPLEPVTLEGLAQELSRVKRVNARLKNAVAKPATKKSAQKSAKKKG